MNPDELKALQDGLKNSFEDLKKTNDEKLATELKSLGVSELKEKAEAVDAEMEKIEAKLDAAQKSDEAKDAKLEAFEAKFEELNAAAQRQGGADSEEKKADDERAKIFTKFLREGEESRSFTAEEFKALSTDSDPDGGYVMTPAMEAMLTTYLFETSEMRAHADVMNISANEMIFTLDNDELTTGWVGEKENRTETSTPQFGQKKIVCNEIYAEPRITQRAVDDAAIPLEAWLSGKISDQFSREENTTFTNGDGIEKPRGFLTYPDGVVGPGIASQELIEQIVTGDAAALTTDAFFDMESSLKSKYMGNAKWFTNRKSIGDIRKLQDGQGNYIWDPGFNGATGPSVLGKTIVRFEDMPAVGAGALPIAFGDMKETYQILDRIGIRIQRDNITKKGWVKYYTTKRVGGDVKNFESLKLMKVSV